MVKEELISKIYSKAYAKSGGRTIGGFTQYYQLRPTKPLKMDDGSIINVEWVQPSTWDDNVLINYRTDNIKTTNLSVSELEQVLEII